MAQIHRVLVPIRSHDANAWDTALAYADALCKSTGGSGCAVVLLVHTRAQLIATDLARFIGKSQSKILDRGDALSLPSGATLRRKTLRTVGTSCAQSVIIAYWADMEMLDAVDGLHGVIGAVVVPEFPDQVLDWEVRWAPIVHGGASSQTPPKLIADPVVEKALKTLDLVVNRATGLIHPRDKDHAKEVFRILRNKGHKANTEGIKSWAITHGWKPKGASALAALGVKILGQKTKPSFSDIHNAEERYQRWK